MLSNNHIRSLKKLVHGNIELDVSMKNHTSFRIGGNAKVILFPRELTDLIEAIRYMEKYKIKYYVFGLGTNLLVGDQDIDFVLIKLGSNFNHVSVTENTITAYSGASINNICMQAYNNSLSGIEDAFGIPGSIGGAVLMNAGAFNFQTSDIVSMVVALVDGKIRVYDNISFGYRYSMFQDFDNIAILQVELRLNKGNKDEIYARMQEIMNKRKDTQPLDKPSAGSVFKRCNELVVSKIIDELGLKGKSVGGAMVSTKHAGFIVNTGNATSLDVKQLISEIKEIVYQKYNVKLIEEIKYLGD